MLEIEPSRTIKEGVVTKGGFIVDLSSKASFKPLLFDQEIKKVGVRTSLYDGHGGAKVMAKLVVIGDKMVVFSAIEEHVDGVNLILALFRDLDFNGIIMCGGHINVDFRKGSWGGDRYPEREIFGSSSSLIDRGDITVEGSEEYKQTVLKEKLGAHFKISGDLPEGFGK
ncbi:hypothetical protein A2W49_01245 [Candidatus Roizmanbacteria bacterium RIFCSPHIGHO2_12_41_18]|nr:MAG: hypothetical protein A3C31_02290 [Candidatus Roizmanbacteria bacterium RIFCSPHIGHO2_02_FULL_40_53]OGK30198.1 MAG: hypothetical protein A2W49_01245 [Candidatus Roizmanbacteria bacterium RIFCSPHIGHO2_12_41_18]